MSVSRTVEDYLTAIWKAEEWGDEVSTTDLAATLGVTPSTVSANLKRISRDGLINYEPYGAISLTGEGRGIALPIVRRHRIIETYLVERLGLGWDQVHDEADRLEHAVSELVLDRMDSVLGHPSHDPHGDSIPGADGTVGESGAIPLRSLAVGAAAQIARISDREPALLRYLDERGLTVGVEFRLDSRNDAANAMGLLRDGHVQELSLEAASAIWVVTVSET